MRDDRIHDRIDPAHAVVAARVDHDALDLGHDRTCPSLDVGIAAQRALRRTLAQGVAQIADPSGIKAHELRLHIGVVTRMGLQFRGQGVHMQPPADVVDLARDLTVQGAKVQPSG